MCKLFSELTHRQDPCHTAAFEKLDVKDKRTPTIPPLDRPLDEVVSDPTQSTYSTMPHTQRYSITAIEAITNKKPRPDASARTNFQALRPVFHRRVIKHQLANALLRLETTKPIKRLSRTKYRYSASPISIPPKTKRRE